MKLALSLLVVALAAVNAVELVCKDVPRNSAEAVRQFGVKLYKVAARETNYHFVMSPYSVYMTLAAMAEGGVGEAQEELFDILKLPKEEHLRREYYEYLLKARPAFPRPDFNLMIARLLVIDENLKLNNTWAEQVSKYNQLTPAILPIKRDPEYTSTELESVLGSKFGDARLFGNSMLLENIEYTNMWETAFPESLLEHNAPFYDDSGNVKTSLSYMRFKKRVRMAYLPESNLKIISLPVGGDHTYSMYFGLPANDQSLKENLESLTSSTITEAALRFVETPIPIEVAIPRIEMFTQFNSLRQILEKIGVTSLWYDPAGTELISYPPAMPNGYLQNFTMHMDTKGILEFKEEFQQAKSVDPTFSFIANKPFYFSLYDNEYKVHLFSGVYSGDKHVFH